MVAPSEKQMIGTTDCQRLVGPITSRLGGASRFSAALGGTNGEGGPSNLLINKNIKFWRVSDEDEDFCSTKRISALGAVGAPKA